MVLFFLTAFCSYSQITIEGKITEEGSNDPLPYVSVLIKDIKDTYIVNFTSTDENGNYSIKLDKDLDSIRVETSSISHLSRMQTLVFDQKKDNYVVNFSLRQRLTELEEVLIEGERKPITVKKDTTVYNINQFKDGTEQVVEDLLKKLPGISIEDNGVIKFKGKQVIRVLLDNDNIFDSNYTIGTKNIDSKIVESVQAIEDYNANPLLKGIKSSEDVAINLVLKKGEVDISGDVSLGLGIEDKKYVRNNTISVSKKIKGFSTISYNNIGENYSPYDFASNTFDLSKSNEYQQRTSNLVNNSGFISNLPNDRTSVNNNFFGSINALYKINQKISVKANYNLFKDRLTRDEKYNTIYDFDSQSLNVSMQEHLVKKPLITAFEYEFIYNINKKSLLTSIGKWDYQNIKRASSGFNNDSVFTNKTKSKDKFIKSSTEYTYRINDKKVFQLFSDISTNNIPQKVDVLYETDEFNQDIDLKKNYLKLQSSLLSKRVNSESEYNIGFDFIENFIDSELIGLDVGNQSSINNSYYKSVSFYGNFKYLFRIGKWKFSTHLKNNLYNIKLNKASLQTDYSDSYLSIRPTILINYYLNKEMHFYLRYALSNHLPEANNMYSGLILINNRTLMNNDFEFNLFNSHASLFGYRINDFYNLVQLDFSAEYIYKKFGYINKLNIDEYTDFYTSIVDVTDNKSLRFNLNFEKYIHFLRSTINFKSSYQVLNYQNIINDSELRNNNSKSLMGQFSIRTGFSGNLNVENKIALQNNFYSNNVETSNSFTSFQNDFKLKYLNGGFQMILNSQYFKPDINDKSSGDLFLDFGINYTTKNEKIEYQIKANNLLNKKKYTSIDQSDYFTSTFEHNLQGQFILFSIKFKY